MSIDWRKTLTSKTIWLGVLMLAASGLEYWLGLPAGASIAQGILGLLSIITRFLTNDSIKK